MDTSFPSVKEVVICLTLHYLWLALLLYRWCRISTLLKLTLVSLSILFLFLGLTGISYWIFPHKHFWATIILFLPVLGINILIMSWIFYFSSSFLARHNDKNKRAPRRA